MKEERLNVHPDDLNHYIEQAHQLRTRELAKLGSRIFRLPQNLLNRFSSSVKAADKTIGQPS